MLKNFWIGAMAASFVLVSGCGGGGGGGGESPGPPAVETRSTVAGPLDAMQLPMNHQVIDPLAAAVAQSPLAGVVECVRELAIGDFLDIADSLSLALVEGGANPVAALAATSTELHAEVDDLVDDLRGLVASLSATGDCGDSGAVEARAAATDPLADSAFAPLVDVLLPALNAAQQSLDRAPGSGLSLGQLANVLSSLSAAMTATNLAMPAGAAEAPIIGAALILVEQSIGNAQVAIAAAASGNVAGTRTAVSTLVEGVVGGLLVDVVPITRLEIGSSWHGLISAPLLATVHAMVVDLESGLLQSDSASEFGGLVDAAMAQWVGPFHQDLLPLIFDPIRVAIDNGAGGSARTGTVLDPVLGQVSGVVDTASMQNLLGSVIGSVGDDCPLHGTVLAGLCGVFEG